MQRLPFEMAQCLNQLLRCAFGQRQPAAVHLIAHQCVPAMSKMHTNLVRAPGFEPHADIAVSSEPFFERVMSHRRLALLQHTHALAIDGMPGNRLSYRSAAGQNTVADRQIIA